MKSLRFLDRRSGYSLASIGLLLGMVVPSLVPAFASAGTLSTRSIAMSSSTAEDTGVNYTLNFTPSSTSAWKYLVIDWCQETPIIGDGNCTVPTDFSASSVTLSGGTAIGTPTLDGTNSTAGHTVIDGTSNDVTTSAFSIELQGVHNPAAGTFYARMYTYAADPGATVSAGSIGSPVDSGAVALSAVNAIGVTAYVQESMTFCVSGQDIWKNCGQGRTSAQTGGVTTPSLTLGVDTGNGSKALSASALSTGTVYTQLSTNAASGAVVNLQSDASNCGGLYLNGDTSKCNIAPQVTPSSTFSAGTADFGLTVGSATTATTDGTNAVTDAIGDLSPTNGYDGSNYFIDYAGSDTSGVTGPYGSALFNSSDGTHAAGPVSNKNIPITLGASINNNTPAGKYGATLRLIATGTF